MTTSADAPQVAGSERDGGRRSPLGTNQREQAVECAQVVELASMSGVLEPPVDNERHRGQR